MRCCRRLMGLALGRKGGEEGRGEDWRREDATEDRPHLPGLSVPKMLRCRMSCFTDGAVIGRKEFVNEAFAGARERYLGRRKDGARRMRGNAKAAAGRLSSVRISGGSGVNGSWEALRGSGSDDGGVLVLGAGIPLNGLGLESPATVVSAGYALHFRCSACKIGGMQASPPAANELAALLRLLDDETPEVRATVSERLMQYGGDISEALPGIPRELSGKEKAVLVEILRPVRREALCNDWLVPSFGTAALTEDWELFEALLRVLSDFLHDGITLRQPLSDALDLLAEEAQTAGVVTAEDLRRFLFVQKRLEGNKVDYYDPRNSDLAWCVAEGVSNPIGLSLIFILVGLRLDLEIEGVCFPGHFLCRFREGGHPMIVDCFDGGNVYSPDAMDVDHLDSQQRRALRLTADPGGILLRVLNNLSDSFRRLDNEEDAELIDSLRDSLVAGAA